MGNYEERKVETSPSCYTCQFCVGLDSSWEELYKFGYCMLDVPQEDIKHVARICYEDEDWDDRFCEIMKIKPGDFVDVEDSPRCTEPNDVCQFYKKRGDV